MYLEIKFTTQFEIDSRTQFKDCLEQLDDCLFVDLLDKIKDTIDFKEFDTLLNKEELSKEESIILDYMISYVSCVLSEMIDNKIDSLQDIRQRLTDL